MKTKNDHHHKVLTKHIDADLKLGKELAAHIEQKRAEIAQAEAEIEAATSAIKALTPAGG